MKAGWAVKPVGEVAEHCLGKMLDKRKNKGTPRPYLRNLNVRWFDFNLDDVLEMKFEDHEAARYTAVRGDVLVCEGGYPGRAAIWERDEPIYFQKAIHRVRFHEPERNRWFLYYLLKCDLDGSLRDHFTGSGIQHFTGKALAKLPIPLPPLEEQQRIVAILDKAFEGLDRAKANAEANLASARELFDAALRDEFAAIPRDWARERLASLTTKIGSGATPKGGKDAYKSSGISLIRSLNVYDREFRSDKLAFIDEQQAKKLNNVIVEPEDVLLNITGASVARCCLAPAHTLPARVNQHVSIIRTIPEQIRPRFLCLLLTAQPMKRQLLQVGSEGGATRQAITKKQIEALEIAFPASNDQDKIIERLTDVESLAIKAADRYRAKAATMNDLRQSLLAKAFAGALT